MADEKPKSEDLIPQADRQAQTDIAQHEGQEGHRRKLSINKRRRSERRTDL
jgi:hypothetical protein